LRRSGGGKEEKRGKKNGKNKGKYRRKPWLSFSQTEQFPEKSQRLRRKLVPGSVVGRSVLQ
jgi:hypothetical protein